MTPRIREVLLHILAALTISFLVTVLVAALA